MKKLLITFSIILGLFSATPALVPAVALADAKDDACAGVALTGGSCGTNAGTGGVGLVVRRVVNILSFVVGIAAVIMIIIGGMKYILSAGDSNSINSAKNTILYAIIGLVIVAFAQIIVRFVINQTTQPANSNPTNAQTNQQEP